MSNAKKESNSLLMNKYFSSKQNHFGKMYGSLPLLSIIVPVYNVEQYLEECINSLLSQTYKNLEIILVDDGSKDNGGFVCDQYAIRFSQIRVVHQENSGLSAARNSGIQIADGEYIAFVDSDDLVSPLFAEALMYAALTSGCKMSCVRKGEYFRDGSTPILANKNEYVLSYSILSEAEYQTELLYQKSLNGTQWRLCHKSIVSSNLFPVGLLFEDLATTYKMVRQAGQVAVLQSTNLYAYRLRPSGIMGQNYKRDKTISCLVVSSQLYCDICNWYPSLRKAAASRCFSITRTMLSQVPNTMSEDIELLWMNIVKYRLVVFLDRNARKRERMASFFAFLGPGVFNLFCKSYKKIIRSQ